MPTIPPKAMQLLLRLLIAVLAVTGAASAHAKAAPPPVTVLSIDGPIGPATVDYIVRGLGRAAGGGVQLVVIELDTPGGLDTSMRAIVKAIVASPVPVATIVAPGGARAASAGVFILYASHVAAMAPGTNMGSATPVQLAAPAGSPGPDSAPSGPGAAPQERGARGAPGPAPGPAGGDMARKQVNDAAAYIRSLAQLRGRNGDWAEQAVREAVSIAAHEALALKAIDYVAADTAELLDQLDGKRLTVGAGTRVLNTDDAALLPLAPDWRVRLLAAITNPSIALLLMMAGFYGLLFEFMSPGAVLPGVVGAVCLLLGLYALQLLPVNYAGLALIVVGLAFMVSEAFLPSFGALGLGGAIALAAGALILIDTDVPGFGIPLALVVAIALGSALLVGATAAVALKTRRRAVQGGVAGVLGASGEALGDTDGQTWARVHGETWQVESRTPLRRGQRLTVVGRKGLVLEVVPSNDNNSGEEP